METTGCSHLFPATSLKLEASKQSTRQLTHFIGRVRLCWSIPQSRHSPEEPPPRPASQRSQSAGQGLLGEQKEAVTNFTYFKQNMVLCVLKIPIQNRGTWR